MSPVPSLNETLIYELLDAHYDTIVLAAGLEAYPVWDAHLAYLRDLQRLGREALAVASEWTSV
jgi:hypothetical protein